jgi:hypothetical protein
LLADPQALIHERLPDTRPPVVSIYGERRKSCRRDRPLFCDDRKMTENDAADDGFVEGCNQGYQDMTFVSKPFNEPRFRGVLKYVGDQLANSGRIGVSFDSYDQRSTISAA